MRWPNQLQVETVREKRRREVEFSKAGLQLPDSDQPFAKRRTQHVSDNDDVYEYRTKSPADYVQSSLAERVILHNTSVSVGSSEKELRDSAPVTSDGCSALSHKEVDCSVKEVANETIEQSMPELPQESSHSFPIEENIEFTVSSF